MSVAIFSDITTESALTEIESNGKKYEGLYVEMDNPPERKYVKGMASDISYILKRLDRARIDKAREYKQQVENEAQAIRERLEAANKPFTLLIDEYSEKRAAILKKEKDAREAIELFQKVGTDHEFAILMNDKYDAEAGQRERDRLQREAELVANAKAEAEAEIMRKIEATNQAEEAKAKADEDARIKRESDNENKAKVNNAALDDLVKAGLDRESAKLAVMAICSKMVRSVRIEY